MIGGKPHWKIHKFQIINCEQSNIESCREALRDTESAEPHSVLIVYEADGRVFTRFSGGMTRLKAMGALAAASIDVWDA